MAGTMASEDFSNAKISVWWDIENCPVPNGVDPHAIAQNISSALSKLDYKGPVSISAFGDTKNLPANIQHALSSTGIALNHVPSGVKDASDKKILVDMLFWAVDNSAPANYLLISGDRDFANALHRLRMRRYNILLAHPTMNVPRSLFGAAKSIWLWTNLAMGGQEITFQDTKQLDKTSDSVSLTNGASKGSLETRNSFSEPNLKDLPSQDFDCLPGMHKNNSGVSFPELDQVSGQLYARNNGVEQTISSTESANGDDRWGCRTYCPETSLLTSTSSRGQELASSCDTRMLAPSNSHELGKSKDTRPPHLHPTYSNSRLNSSNDIKHNVSNCTTMSDSFSRFFSAPFRTNLAPGENALPAKARVPPGHKIRPGCPLQVRPSCLPQETPKFYEESHVRTRPTFPVDPRADIPGFEQLNISSDLRKSPNIQCGPYSSPQFSQLFPSEQISPYIGNIKPSSLTRAETYADAVTVCVSKSSSSHHSGSDVSHRVRMRIILLAMETLKQNMIVPAEENLEDCIRYGDMRIPSFNLRENLDKAVELKDLLVMSTGGGFRVYLPCDTNLWQCVDPLSMHDGYPKEIWDELHKFLLSHEGCEAMVASQSRYDAAQMLKKSCLKTLLLGQIIHVLQLAIKVRRWLRPHHLGWCPLSITISDTCQKSGRSKAGTYQVGNPSFVQK